MNVPIERTGLLQYPKREPSVRTTETLPMLQILHDNHDADLSSHLGTAKTMKPSRKLLAKQTHRISVDIRDSCRRHCRQEKED
jgi:hypothetical protein